MCGVECESEYGGGCDGYVGSFFIYFRNFLYLKGLVMWCWESWVLYLVRCRLVMQVLVGVMWGGGLVIEYYSFFVW